jgi:hypothetical protein
VGFTCSTCGRYHEEELRDVRTELPGEIFDLPEKERERRAHVGSDFAELDGTRFYVRGLLSIPILHEGAEFGWGVWVRVEEQVGAALREHWTDEGAVGRTFDGELAVELPAYGSTLGLAGTLRLRSVDLLPAFELAEVGHSLGLEQRHGISLERARELADPYQQA